MDSGPSPPPLLLLLLPLLLLLAAAQFKVGVVQAESEQFLQDYFKSKENPSRSVKRAFIPVSTDENWKRLSERFQSKRAFLESPSCEEEGWPTRGPILEDLGDATHFTKLMRKIEAVARLREYSGPEDFPVETAELDEREVAFLRGQLFPDAESLPGAPQTAESWDEQWSDPTHLLGRGSFMHTTLFKLEHDMKQLAWLITHGKLPRCFFFVVEAYRSMIDELGAAGADAAAVTIWSPQHWIKIGNWYNRAFWPQVQPQDLAPPMKRTCQPRTGPTELLSPTFDPSWPQTQWATSAYPLRFAADGALSDGVLSRLVSIAAESTTWYQSDTSTGELYTHIGDGAFAEARWILDLVDALRHALPSVLEARCVHTIRLAKAVAPPAPQTLCSDGEASDCCFVPDPRRGGAARNYRIPEEELKPCWAAARRDWPMASWRSAIHVRGLSKIQVPGAGVSVHIWLTPDATSSDMEADEAASKRYSGAWIADPVYEHDLLSWRFVSYRQNRIFGVEGSTSLFMDNARTPGRVRLDVGFGTREGRIRERALDLRTGNVNGFREWKRMKKLSERVRKSSAGLQDSEGQHGGFCRSIGMEGEG